MTAIPHQRWAQLAGVALIALTSLIVLRPFLVPVAWAAILAYATWPLYVRIDRGLRGRTWLSALLMTVLVVLVVVVPAVLVSLALVAELQSALVGFQAWLVGGGPSKLAGALRDIPWFGPRAAAWIEGLVANPLQMEQWVLARTGLVVGVIASTAGDLGRLALDAILTLLTLFFFYRGGGELVPETKRAARRLAGDGVDPVIRTLGETVRAVMYGTLATAIAQALLVTLGAWAAGLGSPVLLGALTGLLALTPAGAPVVYVPACAWLVLQGRVVAGVLLLGWGIVTVSTVDNVIRSWFLRGAARMPFLLGFFGVFGGLVAFGPIGLFVGPITIALLLTLWRDWTRPDAEAKTAT
ncbi:MAG: AI-2E family transporter [Candidatus Rokuibacteriota bacterium]|nr:MAG: AI-2E family transporter [Candidatus Rokubacteria bacterium]